jgi:hypothetical protein
LLRFESYALSVCVQKLLNIVPKEKSTQFTSILIKMISDAHDQIERR